jgi:hypothetical protein
MSRKTEEIVLLEMGYGKVFELANPEYARDMFIYLLHGQPYVIFANIKQDNLDCDD